MKPCTTPNCESCSGIEEVVTVSNICTQLNNAVKTKWFTLNGVDDGTGVEFDDAQYGLFDDGTIVDTDGQPLTPGDSETIAVERATKQL